MNIPLTKKEILHTLLIDDKPYHVGNYSLDKLYYNINQIEQILKDMNLALYISVKVQELKTIHLYRISLDISKCFTKKDIKKLILKGKI